MGIFGKSSAQSKSDKGQNAFLLNTNKVVLTTPSVKSREAQGAFGIYKKKILSIVVFSALIPISIGILLYAFQDHDDSNAFLVQLDEKKIELQKIINNYQEYHSQSEDILHRSKDIPINKLLISNFNDEKLNLLLEKFTTENDIKSKITSTPDDCTSKFQNIKNKDSMKCYQIGLSIDKADGDKINQQLYIYLSETLPGFLIPMKISAEKIITEQQISYKLENQYYFIYFSKQWSYY